MIAKIKGVISYKVKKNHPDLEYIKNPDEVLEFTEAVAPKFNISLLATACKFLGVDRVTLEQADRGGSVCYRIKPLEDMHVANRALEIKAYVMGLK